MFIYCFGGILLNDNVNVVYHCTKSGWRQLKIIVVTRRKYTKVIRVWSHEREKIIQRVASLPPGNLSPDETASMADRSYVVCIGKTHSSL